MASRSIAQSSSAQKPSPETEGLLRIMGDWNAINGRWPRAIERFASLIKLGPPDDWQLSLDDLRLGTALLESGQRDDYERFRQEMVSPVGSAGSTTNSLPDPLITCCLLLPGNPQLLRGLERAADAAENALSQATASRALDASSLHCWNTGGEYQSNHCCARCLSSPDCDAARAALAHVIQAMAYWRLDQYPEGFTELSRAQERIDLAFKNELNLNPNNDPAQNWFDWIIARILLRECQERALKATVRWQNDSAHPPWKAPPNTAL